MNPFQSLSEYERYIYALRPIPRIINPEFSGILGIGLRLFQNEAASTG